MSVLLGANVRETELDLDESTAEERLVEDERVLDKGGLCKFDVRVAGYASGMLYATATRGTYPFG